MLEPPAADELEITVFGRGFGESIAIHVGHSEWVIVDSYYADDGRPVALKYLEDLEGDHRARAIVVTHWDDDHIKGVANLISEYDPEEVWLPPVLNNDEAFAFAFEHVKHEEVRGTITGLKQFVRTIQELDERPGVTRFSLPGREVLGSSPTLIKIMSPHDEIVRQGFQALGITQRPGEGEIASPKPNDTSSVLWVERDGATALLGADLRNSTWGWKYLVKQPTPTGAPADFIKSPHHGSPDAHNAEIYTTLGADEINCAVTRYTRGVTPRPAPEDRAKIRPHVTNGFVLGEWTRASNTRYAADVELASIGPAWLADGATGFLRVRHQPDGDQWTAKTFGATEIL